MAGWNLVDRDSILRGTSFREFAARFDGKINLGGFRGGPMSNEAGNASDVPIDLSGRSLSDLSEYGDSHLLRALRRFLAADNEASVVAEWNEGI